MAINVYRSPRAIDFAVKSTADKVGPGTYANTHNEVIRTVEEKGVPFQSLQEKELCQNKSTSALTPGPGAYLDPEAPELSKGADQRKKQSSTFKSRSKRMCPTAPGSSVFLPSTIVENPGPGSYPIQKNWSKSSLKPKEHQAPVLELAHTVPSIPAQKVQPNAVPAERKDSEMAGVRMKHTGEKKDTVGPAEYDISHAGKVTQKETQLVNFHSSNSTRRLFEPSSFIENRLPPRQNPGPGTYESMLQHEEQLSASGSVTHSYMFASKTPMASDRNTRPDLQVPGPGAYKTIEEAKINRGEAGMKSQFGSTVDRRGWSRPMNQPFTDPYNLKVPGPGHYPDPKSNFITPRKPSSDPSEVLDRKKYHGVHHPAQIMALQEMSGPLHAFHSTDIRPCNRKIAQTTPAPGEHNNEDTLGFSITSVLKEKATVGKKGVFGTTAARFDGRSAFGPKSGLSVDAGKYDVADSGKSEDAPRSMFQSQSPRFRATQEKGDGGFADTYAVTVGKRQGPGPADYITDKEVNYRSPFRHPRREHLSFGTGRPRFDAKEIFHGQQYNLNPGPGDYNPAKRRGVPGSARTGAQRALAGTLGSTGLDVGPGSYDTHGSLLKKTYNVSTEQPAELTL